MKIIRGRLSADDVSNPSFRYDAECDCIQYSPDGGTTWVDAPEADPRHSTRFLKPPVAGSSKQCDSAANMVKWLHDFIDQMLFDFTLVASVTTIINSILLELEILAPYIELLAIISELAETISTAGATTLEAAFTEDQYALLLCIFECNEDADGRVSAAKLIDIEGQITAQLNTTAALITNAILFVQGEIGLSNAGAVGSETGDCSDCDCCDNCTPIDTTLTELCYTITRGVFELGNGVATTFSSDPSQLNDLNVLDVPRKAGATVTHAAFSYNAPTVLDGGLVIIIGVAGGVGTELLRETLSAGSGSVGVDVTDIYDVFRFLLVTSQFDSGTAKGWITEVSLTCA